jgi:hypothetical protein
MGRDVSLNGTGWLRASTISAHRSLPIPETSSESYVVTSGTGSGKSPTYFWPMVDNLVRQPTTGDRMSSEVRVVDVRTSGRQYNLKNKIGLLILRKSGSFTELIFHIQSPHARWTRWNEHTRPETPLT